MLMFSRNTCRIVSGFLVPTMLCVAVSEFQHGVPIGEIHLISPVQLAPASSTAMVSGLLVHQNTITEAHYYEPAQTTPLRHDGLIHPST
jgi:hypothetical protein